MEYQCELLDRPSQPALVIRTRAPVESLPPVLGQAWGAIIEYAGQLGIHPSGGPFVAYYNMDMQDLDMEIGFPFGEKAVGKGDILAGEIPGGKAAAYLHVGPYDQLGVAYETLQQWMQTNGYMPTGVAYEFYLNSPQETPPAELQTQLLFPLK